MSIGARHVDSVSIDDLRIPYDPYSKTLDNQPSLTAGSNVYQSQNGTLRKRGGFGDTDLTAKTTTGRFDRIGIYKTNEDTPKVYLIASIFRSDVTAGQQWNMAYLRLDAGGTPVWLSMPNLRGLNNSGRPHEWVVARGKVYIKSYPPSGVDLLGTVIFDGSGGSPSTTYWGLLGPTTPARRNGTSSSWAASTGSVTVRVGWTYVYTWKTLTGQESPRSPVETDPTATPSTTGAFTNKKPQMIVQGHSDTTNIPTIVIYRTSDGGGSYRFVEEITNTGAGNITYIDDSVSNTPVLDAALDPSNVAPSPTSNTPPPAVTAPSVTGVDAIVRSTPPVYWRGRIWYAIGSTVFFSGDDEIRKGQPLECFPTGFFGNFFLFENQIAHLIAADEQLWVVTEGSLEQITGRFRDEFSSRTVQKIVGGVTQQPRASLALGNAQFWLAQDYRVLQNVAGQVTALSTPLATELSDTASANVEWELKPYLANGITWLIVAAHNTSNPTLSKWWVYDLATGLWSPPWTGMPSTALTYGRYRENDPVPSLICAVWNGSLPGQAAASRYLSDTYTDFTPGTGDAGYAFSATTGLLEPLGGNQLNSGTIPALETSFNGVRLEWLNNPAAPTVEVATDDAGTPATALTAQAPTLTAADTSGYTTRFYFAETAAQRAALKVSRSADTEEFILESVAFMWEPRQGG